MNGKDFNEVVSLIVKDDPRYDRSAYQFIREALDFTVKRLREGASRVGDSHHVSGRDLCLGARDYALQQYGPMAATLLRHWGIERTEDFGEMVFNLVELEVFGAREEDRPEDFAGVYDFEAAFEEPFRPEEGAAAKRPSPSTRREAGL